MLELRPWDLVERLLQVLVCALPRLVAHIEGIVDDPLVLIRQRLARPD